MSQSQAPPNSCSPTVIDCRKPETTFTSPEGTIQSTDAVPTR
jgi:hypothetical protein